MFGFQESVVGTGMFKSFKLGTEVASEGIATEGSTPGVEEIVAENSVVLFVSSSCPYCAEATRSLAAAGIPFHEVEVTAPLRRELFELTGQTSVPSGWIKGKFCGGCNDGPEDWMGILPMLHSGKMQELLAA